MFVPFGIWCKILEFCCSVNRYDFNIERIQSIHEKENHVIDITFYGQIYCMAMVGYIDYSFPSIWQHVKP